MDFNENSAKMPSGPENHFPTKCIFPGIIHARLRTLNMHLQKTWHEKVLDNLYQVSLPLHAYELDRPPSVEIRQAALRQ